MTRSSRGYIKEESMAEKTIPEIEKEIEGLVDGYMTNIMGDIRDMERLVPLGGGWNKSVIKLIKEHLIPELEEFAEVLKQRSTSK